MLMSMCLMWFMQFAHIFNIHAVTETECMHCHVSNANFISLDIRNAFQLLLIAPIFWCVYKMFVVDGWCSGIEIFTSTSRSHEWMYQRKKLCVTEHEWEICVDFSWWLEMEKHEKDEKKNVTIRLLLFEVIVK